MKIAPVIAAIVLFAIPAFGAECVWQEEDGAIAVENSPIMVTIIEGEHSEICDIRGAGPGNAIRIAQCGDYEWPFFTVASTAGGEADILIFQNVAWYRKCGGERP